MNHRHRHRSNPAPRPVVAYSTTRPGQYPILTAAEFQQQGTSAAAVLSIGTWFARNGNPAMAAHVKGIAHELAGLTGKIVKTKRLRVPAPANNNRAVRYGRAA